MKILSGFVERQRQSIVSPYLNGNILDLGCGYGTLIRYHSLNPEDYLGVDQDPIIINWLRNHFPEYKAEARDLDFELLDFSRKFDTIVMTAVLEHLKSPTHLFEQLPDLLSEKGTLVITTPTPLGGKIHKFGSMFGMFYREAADDHEKFYNEKDLRSLLQSHGLTTVSYKPFLFGGNQILVGKLS